MKYSKVDERGKGILGAVDSLDVNLDTTNFNKNLGEDITDVQKLADKVDDLVLGGMPEGVENQTLRYGINNELVATDLVQIVDSQINEVEGYQQVARNYSVNLYADNYEGDVNSFAGINIDSIMNDVPSGLSSYSSFTLKSQFNSEIEGETAISKIAKIELKTDSLQNSSIEIQADKVYIDYLAGTGTRPLVALSDGTIAVGEGNGGSLPEGTVNQTLRHNGTEWVANSVIESLDRGDGYTCGFNMNITDGGFGYHYDPVYSIRYEFLHAPTGSNTIDNMTLDRESLTLSKETTSLDGDYTYGTMRIVSDEIFIDTYSSELDINKSVKINTNEITHSSLIGTTSSLLEATTDGTIQRSTATIPAPQVNSDWNATEGVAQILNKPVLNDRKYIDFISNGFGSSLSAVAYSNTTLGLDGVNLIEKVKNVKAFVQLVGETEYTSVPVQGEIIRANQIEIDFNFSLAAGVKCKLYIEYID